MRLDLIRKFNIHWRVHGSGFVQLCYAFYNKRLFQIWVNRKSSWFNERTFPDRTNSTISRGASIKQNGIIFPKLNLNISPCRPRRQDIIVCVYAASSNHFLNKCAPCALNSTRQRALEMLAFHLKIVKNSIL